MDGFEAGLTVLCSRSRIASACAWNVFFDWVDELVVVQDLRLGEEQLQRAGDGEFAHAGEGFDVDHWCWHCGGWLWEVEGC